MIKIHTLGFPRIGGQRELKFALERYWKGEIAAPDLERIGGELRLRHWALQKQAGLDVVTVGDFAYYDHVANHIQLFGCEPKRFREGTGTSPLDRYFAMARGVSVEAREQGSASNEPDSPRRRALEMTKWFDTNYHYLVPEFDSGTPLELWPDALLEQVAEAQALGHPVKVALIGPMTFLWLGKSKEEGFDRLDLLDRLVQVYRNLLERLADAGVPWVQLDEPVLGLDLTAPWILAFERAYHALQTRRLSLMLTTYFSPLEGQLSLACRLPVACLHIDAVRAPAEVLPVLDWLPSYRQLSIGIVDGRNIWRTDPDKALGILKPALARRGGSLWLAPSCSLLHVPMTLASDASLDAQLRGWVAGAVEKLDELRLLKQALSAPASGVGEELEAARRSAASRAGSPRVKKPAVSARVHGLPDDADRRRSTFALRQPRQRERFRLPDFPTTTIGSFPQTADIRAARAAFRRGELSADGYREAMRNEIALVVRKQEDLDIDVLVHGEAERNDMVEYFGEQLDGFAFTANGWVQSYGSRCVKPPILFGDVSRPAPMTVDWTMHAQSLTRRPMKGMLTGPITILQWSFVRDDQPRSETSLQLALAIRDEVLDLERAGIGIIQIDEPAFREGLPLRRAGWKHYLAWAARAFRISASGVGDTTQIHTHMCYSEFNDILPEIASLDADVITVETSRSDMELLKGFGEFRYPNEIGPGVYDIHSPRVPTTDEMVALLRKAAAVVTSRNLWVNPDCGLKTRAWPETEGALRRMVCAAKTMRAQATVPETAQATTR